MRAYRRKWSRAMGEINTATVVAIESRTKGLPGLAGIVVTMTYLGISMSSARG